jgi:F-type H+-transporting ATPase subunit b
MQKIKLKHEYDRIVADAQIAINQQKNAALTDVKNQVGALVIEISEKILRKELSDKAEQENYIKQLAEEVKLTKLLVAIFYCSRREKLLKSCRIHV